jgi:CheY-like chemotaxis protein
MAARDRFVSPRAIRKSATSRPLCHLDILVHIAASGYGETAVGRAGFVERSAAYLQKPFTPEALAHAVREALDAAR